MTENSRALTRRSHKPPLASVRLSLRLSLRLSFGLLLTPFVVANADVQHGCGRRRFLGGILRPNWFRIRPIKGMRLGCSRLLRSFGMGGAPVPLGDVRPAEVEAERDAWAEHFD